MLGPGTRGVPPEGREHTLPRAEAPTCKVTSRADRVTKTGAVTHVTGTGTEPLVRESGHGPGHGWRGPTHTPGRYAAEGHKPGSRVQQALRGQATSAWKWAEATW